MKSFGDYIRERREKLQLDQAEVKGFNGPYISAVERRGKRIARKTTIEKLAEALQLDMSERAINWLWVYSLLDYDPREYFGHNGVKALPALYTAETKGAYGGKIQIRPGTSADDVLRQLGQPEVNIDVGGPEVKWIYKEEGLAITLEGGVVKRASFT